LAFPLPRYTASTHLDRTEPRQRETRSGLPGSCCPLSDHADRTHDWSLPGDLRVPLPPVL